MNPHQTVLVNKDVIKVSETLPVNAPSNTYDTGQQLTF